MNGFKDRTRALLIYETDFDVPLPLNLTDEELLDPYLREGPDEAEALPQASAVSSCHDRPGSSTISVQGRVDAPTTESS